MRLALAVLAGVLAPALAPALELSGHLGLTYQRADTWIDRATHQAMPRLDLDLGAVASGVVVSRDYLAWQLDANWRRITQDTDGQRTSLSQSLFFGGRAGLFNSLRSPVTITLDGARTFTRFSSTTSLDVTGETVAQSYGAQASLRAEGLPTLALGYRWNAFDADIQGQPTHTRTVHVLSGSTYVGGPAFKLTASYAGELSDGSWTTDRYDTHRASVSVHAPIAPGTELFLDEQYLLTKPTSLLAVGAQELENNFFRAFATNSGNFGDRHVVSYAYGRLVSQPAGGPVSEATRQAVRYEGDLLLTSPTLFTRWIVDASLNQARAGTTALDSSGETLGVQLWWRRASDEALYEAWAGPLVGFVQSNTDGDSNGWGASGQVRASQPWLGQLTSLTYRLDYASDLFGAKGTSLRQGLSASMSGGLLSGHYTLTGTAGASRTTSPIFGDGADRSLGLFFNTSFRDLVADASFTLQQGIEGATPKDFTSDGLFIPAPFDARTVQAYARATYELYPGLGTTGQVRWLSSTHPGHPTLDQTEVLGSLQYRYGAFNLAVEDRYGWIEVPTGNLRVNQVMFRLYRQLGWGR